MQFFSRTALALLAGTVALPAQTLTTLVNFDWANGAEPYQDSLVQGSDGNFYGETNEGGAHGGGTVFRVTPAGVLTTLYNFCAKAGCTDGTDPYGGLMQSPGGNFHGTTAYGGSSGHGTIFRLTPGGVLTTLHSFSGSDGAGPVGALLLATNGSIYGTTTESAEGGYGTVFRITAAGKFKNLFSFSRSNGSEPYGGLIEVNGLLYGTTFSGGTSSQCTLSQGCGTIFSITTEGVLTTLHSFGTADGSATVAALTLATDGALYGVCQYGGSNGSGTVFRITTAGQFTLLHTFQGPDGADPTGTLIQASDGNLYGTTSGGGTGTSGLCAPCGTIFRITTAGELTTLYNFSGSDGAFPEGGLIEGTDGKLYGTTTEGGAVPSAGTVFSLTGALASHRP